MKSRYSLTLVLVLPLLISCGQVIRSGASYTAQESITSASPVAPQMTSPFIIEPAPGQFIKIAILPFSDLSSSYPFNFPVFGRRNLLILEALQDEFYKYGFMPVMQEEVTEYLISRGIIQEVGSVPDASESIPMTPETGVLLRELNNPNPYTEGMRAEIIKGIYQNAQLSMNNSGAMGREGTPKGDLSRRLIVLDDAAVQELGNTFGADYVVRGRIIEFGTEEYESYNPLQTGILPFFFKVGTNTVFGVSRVESYESSAGPGCILNRTFLAGDRNRRAVVQLRMLVQNAITGEIVWTNRTEVETTPLSVFADERKRTLYAQAIQHAARSLVEDFVQSRVSGRYVAFAAPGCTPEY